MIKIVGDFFDDLGCWFAHYDLDTFAGFFHKVSELIDPERVEI